jgi:hypothetical protein
MQILLFTIVGIALYFAADWALRRIERARGAPLPHRDLVYFGIILSLALLSFTVLERLGP